MICKNCGKNIQDGSRFCAYCGAAVEERPRRFCTHCGREIDPNAAVCVHCGFKVGESESINRQANKAYCTHCGREIDSAAHVCVYCGATVNKGVYSSGKVRGIAFAIISIVLTTISLGFLGAILASIGVTYSLYYNDAKGTRFNIAAIIYCVAMSIVTIIVGLL